MAKKIINEILIPEKIKEQLKKLGIKEDDINNETAVTVALFQQALKGNVSAINTVNKMFTEDRDETEVKEKDITEEVEIEENKIKENLKDLKDKQLKINSDLIHNIAFMGVTLRNLANEISKNGVKEKYKNGANQWGYKDRTEVKTYNNMFKNYQSAIKQLNELLLETRLKDDGFDNDDLGDAE